MSGEGDIRSKGLERVLDSIESCQGRMRNLIKWKAGGDKTGGWRQFEGNTLLRSRGGHCVQLQVVCSA